MSSSGPYSPISPSQRLGGGRGLAWARPVDCVFSSLERRDGDLSALDAVEVTTAIRSANRVSANTSEFRRFGFLFPDSRMVGLCELAGERYRTATCREREKDSTVNYFLAPLLLTPISSIILGG